MSTITKLDFSIPANNQKIIELYNKLIKEELQTDPNYQRKLVWKKQHKFKFIETILQNFPFPEIYLAPGELNTETLSLKDQIVDGQQRLTTIKDYIEGKGVFSAFKTPIKKFNELERSEKEAFLNYEISVRYLKNATPEQIKEIFQRINSTEYSLNKTERINAQWGESEFICFGKQIIEKELDIDESIVNYKILEDNRVKFLTFFHEKNKIFTDNDISRMLALQYILTLLATICAGEYFRRNDKVQFYIQHFYEDFVDAGTLEPRLLETIEFIDSLGLDSNSYWFNKANIFTLIVEVYKYDFSLIDKKLLKEKLDKLDSENKIYSQTVDKKIILAPMSFHLPSDTSKYFEYAREAVNEKTVRDFRGDFVNKLLRESTQDVE